MKKTDIFDSALSDRGTTISLTVPIPLFNRGQHDGTLAKAQAAVATSRHEAQLLSARAEIEAAYRDVMRRREAEERYRQLADTEELVRTAEIAYDEGEKSILELLDAYQVALNVRTRSLALAAYARKARITLDLVVGEEVNP